MPARPRPIRWPARAARELRAGYPAATAHPRQPGGVARPAGEPWPPRLAPRRSRRRWRQGSRGVVERGPTGRPLVSLRWRWQSPAGADPPRPANRRAPGRIPPIRASRCLPPRWLRQGRAAAVSGRRRRADRCRPAGGAAARRRRPPRLVWHAGGRGRGGGACDRRRRCRAAQAPHTPARCRRLARRGIVSLDRRREVAGRAGWSPWHAARLGEGCLGSASLPLGERPADLPAAVGARGQGPQDPRPRFGRLDRLVGAARRLRPRPVRLARRQAGTRRHPLPGPRPQSRAGRMAGRRCAARAGCLRDGRQVRDARRWQARREDSRAARQGRSLRVPATRSRRQASQGPAHRRCAPVARRRPPPG